MNRQKDEFTDAEIEQRMRETVRRSFQMPHKMQKEMVGKVGRSYGKKSKVIQKAKETP